MAYPDALIYHFSDEGIHPIEYKETEHYTVTKGFLDRPEKILRYLLDDSEDD